MILGDLHQDNIFYKLYGYLTREFRDEKYMVLHKLLYWTLKKKSVQMFQSLARTNRMKDKENNRILPGKAIAGREYNI